MSVGQKSFVTKLPLVIGACAVLFLVLMQSYMIMYKRSISRHQARNWILCIFLRERNKIQCCWQVQKIGLWSEFAPVPWWSDFGPKNCSKVYFFDFLEGKISPIFELHVCTRGLFLDRGWETGILCISCGKETRYYLKADILSFPKC